MFANDYFTESELACRCCGKNHFKDSTLKRLIKTRIRYEELLREAGVTKNFGLIVSSGYRCPAYNARNNYTMTHSTGQAVDLRVALSRSYYLQKAAYENGWTGIGVSQKGDFKARYIHLDDLPAEPGERTRPTVWSY